MLKKKQKNLKNFSFCKIRKILFAFKIRDFVCKAMLCTKCFAQKALQRIITLMTLNNIKLPFFIYCKT